MVADSLRPESRLRPTAWSGLAAVAASVLLSVLARTNLGDSVRIRWSVGTYYGPEFAPTDPVFAAFPVAAAALYVGFRRLAARLERADDLGDGRIAYELSVLLTLLVVLLIQVVLLVANLA
jgi:hypothetical protein